MLLVVELTANDEAAAVRTARILDDYLEGLLGGAGLLKYRIARNTSDPARIVLLEEWTTPAAHAALAKTPAFAALQGELAALLAGPSRASECEIVAAGVASE